LYTPEEESVMSIEILADADTLALRAADLFALAAQEAAAARGRFAVALSGGDTPRALYRLLARQQFSQKVPWRHVQLYWGDERCVPPDDAASNYGMAHEAFIRHVPVPADNVHPVSCAQDAATAAQAYEGTLRDLAALERPHSDVPVFDLVLLGLGADGHIASLFPHGDALGVTERWAAPSEAPDGTPRVTITYPVINAARHVWFLVSGAQKAGMVAEVLEGLRAPEAVPAQGVAPATGRLAWLLDAAAAAQLSAAVRG
jgi:6-phosphogluconolactonase